MKEIRVGQVWESKEGVRELSKQNLEIVGRLNSKCWQTRDTDKMLAGFIGEDELRQEFVLKAKK